MIISASRRTDLPNYYADWFFQRLRAGYVLTRNPVNHHQVSRISLAPDVVDGIVFWTKNPAPMLERLEELRGYPYYFQFTLNAYGTDVEPHVPSKKHVVVPVFQELSRRAGKERVVWRYDPVLLSGTYTMDHHITCFRMLAKTLCGYTELCTVSFVDYYRNTQSRLRPLGGFAPSDAQKMELLRQFARAARDYGMQLNTCAETVDAKAYGVTHASCIDRVRLERIAGCRLLLEKDKNQRRECGCAASIDIGMYDTCRNGCRYCYANHSGGLVERRAAMHDPSAPLLSGTLQEGDVIRERAVKSCRDGQLGFTI